jgi:mono/diheme cytochrome c family protein
VYNFVLEEWMRRLLFGVGAIAVVALGGSGLRTVAAQDAAGKPAFFTEKVKPILEANCASCHLGTNHKGGLSMATKNSLLKGGRDGVVIVPGDPAKSLLVALIRHEGPADDPMPMPPPPRPQVSDADIATVTQWIKAGAAMPDDVPAP